MHAGPSVLGVNWKPALPRANQENGAPRGRGLFGAVGYPVEVVEFLGVARVGVVGAFVFVFDVGAGGLHSFAGFSRGVACAAVDGAAGGFGKGEGGEG